MFTTRSIYKIGNTQGFVKINMNKHRKTSKGLRTGVVEINHH